MSDSIAKAFGDFFEALHGYDPFPWQTRLVQRVLERGWPEALSLPTAAGKTACIDIAVFVLAKQVEQGAVTTPRRIAWMVDRRVIVDEAYQRSQFVAARLREAEEGPLRFVADSLRRLGGGDTPLATARLRGGVYRDQAWAKTPTQATVICSTVDQIGSRILFRGYGVGNNSLALHAGLAANDCLLVLDEAHVSEPMRQTLAAVQSYRDKHASYSPLATLFVSATPPSGLHDVVTADKQDRAHAVLGKRIGARKPTELVSIKDPVAAAVKQAKEMRKAGVGSIAVMVNRVATAKQIHAALAKDAVAILLTGRMREVDRAPLLEHWLPQLQAGAEASQEVFVVATQTLEVGANLDFDGLVTECASLDALRQRFGRLNRLGLKETAPGVILIRQRDIAPKTDDPIYGQALPATWQWLNEHANKGLIDMGVAAVSDALDGDSGVALSAPRADAPVLLPAHLDLWAQTSPRPAVEPDVSLWLHGMEHASPTIQVVWRADLLADNREQWVEIVSALAPASPELLDVRLSAFRLWLDGESQVETEDVSHQYQPVSSRSDVAVPPDFVIWRGPEEAIVSAEAGDIRPGDIVVLPAGAGGWDQLGCIQETGQIDRGEVAQLMSRRRPILRLTPGLLASWPDAGELPELLATGEFDETQLQDALAAAVPPSWLQTVADALRDSRTLHIAQHPNGIIVIGDPVENPEADIVTSEDDSASTTGFVSLDEHSAGVAQWAHDFARGCNLPDELVTDIELAASAHDLGKSDPRFQAWLQGGIRLGEELLAKSGGLQSVAAIRKARGASGYPRGGRHELLSVRLLQSVPNSLQSAHDLDLVLHLVASHHGRCRPFAPVIEDPDPVEVVLPWRGHELRASSQTGLETLDSGVAERFWNLVEKYGYWGLAYLESILILADRRRSESEVRP